MIATYINNKTKEEVFVQDFTATMMAENGEQSGNSIVIYKTKKEYHFTLVITTEIFNNEFTKKK